jgi:hypothetical protein
MPMTGSREERFDEFRHGKTFKKTAAKYGRKKAQKQMIAAVLSSERRDKKKRSAKSR